jgi:hypothetical protein
MCRWAGKNMTNGTPTQSCTPRRRRGRSTAAGAGAAGGTQAIEPGQAGLATPCAATGQQLAGLDPALAEHALNWSRGMLRPEFRGPDKAFGVEVPVPDDAPAYDRLAGWFGRDPGWTAPGASRAREIAGWERATRSR